MSVYNCEQYVSESISSIQNQTFTDWQFYIMDDGSTDGTRKILKEISDPRIHCFYQENAGLTVSLNRLLSKVESEYVARQDADDISFADRFKTQIDFLDTHPEVGLLGTWAVQVDQYGDTLQQTCPASSFELIKQKLPSENTFIHTSIMARTKLLRSVGGYRQEFKCSQDYDLVLRLSEKTELANIEQFLCSKRARPDMVGVKKIGEQKYYAELAREMFRQRQKKGTDAIASGDFKPESLDCDSLNKNGQIIYQKHLISAWLRKGECLKVRNEIKILLTLSPFEPYAYVQYLLSFLGSGVIKSIVKLWDRTHGY